MFGTTVCANIWLHFKCCVKAFSNSSISAENTGPPFGPPVLFTRI